MDFRGRHNPKLMTRPGKVTLASYMNRITVRRDIPCIETVKHLYRGQGDNPIGEAGALRTRRRHTSNSRGVVLVDVTAPAALILV